MTNNRNTKTNEFCYSASNIPSTRSNQTSPPNSFELLNTSIIFEPAIKKVHKCAFSSFSVKVKSPENTNINQAIKDRFTDARDLEKHAKSVLVEAIYAVRAAEAHAADNEIMMAATEKVYDCAKSSFLKARLQKKEVKASLEAAIAGEKNSQMPIRKDNNKKQDAAAAPVEEKTATTVSN